MISKISRHEIIQSQRCENADEGCPDTLENSQDIIYWIYVQDNMDRRQTGENFLRSHNTYGWTQIQNNYY